MTRARRRVLMERKVVGRMLAGDSDRQIAKSLRVRRQKVQELRAKAKQLGYLDGTTPLPGYPQAIFEQDVDGRSLKTSAAEKLLDTQRDWIKARLESGWLPITVFKEFSVSVARSSFYRYVNRYKLRSIGRCSRRVIPEIVHEPGEALILDWGKIATVTYGGKKRTLWCFAGVLGYSRFIVAKAVWSNDARWNNP